MPKKRKSAAVVSDSEDESGDDMVAIQQVMAMMRKKKQRKRGAQRRKRQKMREALVNKINETVETAGTALQNQIDANHEHVQGPLERFVEHQAKLQPLIKDFVMGFKPLMARASELDEIWSSAASAAGVQLSEKDQLHGLISAAQADLQRLVDIVVNSAVVVVK